MSTYTIDYRTGIKHEETGTLAEAMTLADCRAAYTQEDIVILDNHGNEQARRRWIGCEDGVADETSPIVMGGGYYSDWVDPNGYAM